MQEGKYFDYISAVNQIGPGFIVAHEYGHYFKNHFNKRKSKELEFIADEIAFDITMERCGDLSIPLILKYLGIELALLLSQTIQEITNVCIGTTHPIFDERIQRIRKT